MARNDRTTLLSLAAEQHGVFTTAQATRAGVDRHALRRWATTGEISQVGPGVWLVAGAPGTDESRAMAAVLGGGADAVLATSSAAWAWEIPGHRVDPIQVLRRRTAHVGSSGVHRTSRCVGDDDVTVRRGLPVTSPVRTIFDLAGRQHAGRTRRDLNNLMARGLVTLDGLDDGLGRLAKRGRSGIRVMRALIDELREKGTPAGSSLELVAEQALSLAGFQSLERQVVLGDEDGVIARVDFADRRRRAAIEIDSDRFHGGLVDRMIDEAKTTRLTAVGWTVIRITEHELWWDRDALDLRLRRLRASLDLR